MYFLTYNHNSETKIGILIENRIISMSDIFNILNKKSPQSMYQFVSTANDKLIEQIRDILDKTDFKSILLNDVKVCPPIIPPRNVFCIGKNYRDHINELKGKTSSDTGVPKQPVYFTKSLFSIIGDKDSIKNHSHITSHIDYEVELAVVIGKNGVNIKKEDVYKHIFGYTIANDVTARNIQKVRNQWFKGKSLDTFCPMGPYIIHKSIIPYPVELNISCRVNDEIRQSSNTKNMIFDIAYIISDLSSGMELKSGDVILTGTPAGVGFGFNPPKFLKTGDVVKCYIEKIGQLINTVEN